MFREGIWVNWTKHRTKVIWFENNYLNLNRDKSRLIVSGYRHALVYAKMGTTKIWEARNVIFSGINIDKKSKFNEYILEICFKVGRNLSALSRMPC